MIVREICKDDIAQCLAIYNYNIKNTCIIFEETPIREEQFGRRIMAIAEKHPFFVAVEDKKVVGYAYLDVFNERSAFCARSRLQ